MTDPDGGNASRLARRRPSFAVVAKISAPAVLVAAFWYVVALPPTPWSRFHGLALAFASIVYIAVVIRGWVRNATLTVAPVVFGLAAIEAYCVVAFPSRIEIITPGYSVSRPILGWGPGQPGVFHHTMLAPNTGQVIFDADYTIGPQLIRVVVSAEAGPVVAFFGDSGTFGLGVPDAQTLPQLYADAIERRSRVLNLAFSGFGPQQFLRALEAGVYDTLLKETSAFVFPTVPWHAEWSGCMRDFMMRAPRYELVDGQPSFRGTCGKRWAGWLQSLSSISSIYSVLVEPLLGRAGTAEMDLYIAIFVRAGQLAREKYGAATVILYIPDANYVRHTGYTDQQIMQRLRDGGLVVIDGGLDPASFPGQDLTIPADGHPTALANRVRAAMLVKALAGRMPPGL